jgi:phosphate transport system ATP-binding protein
LRAARLSLNRMHELVPGARAEGGVMLENQDIYTKDVDPVSIRRRIGMVFQKPNPFSKSIYENVAWGARINCYKGARAVRVGTSRSTARAERL